MKNHDDDSDNDENNPEERDKLRRQNRMTGMREITGNMTVLMVIVMR